MAKRVTEEKKAIGRRIAEARKAAGLTQNQLAQLAGVGLRSVQAWEQGQTNPYRRLRLLENILGRPGAWILHGTGQEASKPAPSASGMTTGERIQRPEYLDVLRALGVKTVASKHQDMTAIDVPEAEVMQRVIEGIADLRQRLEQLEERVQRVERFDS